MLKNCQNYTLVFQHFSFGPPLDIFIRDLLFLEIKMIFQKSFQFFVKKNRSQFTKHWQIYSLQCSKIGLRKKQTSKSLFFIRNMDFLSQKKIDVFFTFLIIVWYQIKLEVVVHVSNFHLFLNLVFDRNTWTLIRKIKDQNIVSFCHSFTYKSDYLINQSVWTLILARFFGNNTIKLAIKCFGKEKKIQKKR
jgi:hypothetical protein